MYSRDVSYIISIFAFLINKVGYWGCGESPQTCQIEPLSSGLTIMVRRGSEEQGLILGRNGLPNSIKVSRGCAVMLLWSEEANTPEDTYMGTVIPRGGGEVNEEGGGGRVSTFLGSERGRVFSPKMPKVGSVNSVFMRFSITIFPGRVSDFRLRSGVASPPPKGLKRGVTPPNYLTYGIGGPGPRKKFPA